MKDGNFEYSNIVDCIIEEAIMLRDGKLDFTSITNRKNYSIIVWLSRHTTEATLSYEKCLELVEKKFEAKKEPNYKHEYFIYDNYSKCYFYEIDSWGNHVWGNDKNMAEKFSIKKAEKFIIDASIKDRDKKLMIGMT